MTPLTDEELVKSVRQVIGEYGAFNHMGLLEGNTVVAGIVALIRQRELEARVSELESLDHNKQMFGDWQQVIEDRIAQLTQNQSEAPKTK
jgi:hypothetical protein